MKKLFAVLLAGMIGVAFTTAPMGCSKETTKKTETTTTPDKDKSATTTTKTVEKDKDAGK